MKKSNLSLFLFVSLLFFAFIPNKEDFKVIREEGIPVAVNPDFPVPAEDSPKDIIFEEELTLGSIGSEPETMFGDFISYTVDEKGNIYVLDWRAKAVKKFGPDGHLILTFGREGQGPGEFSSPEEIRLLSNNRLVIYEGESQKYSLFTLEGHFIKSGRFSKLMYSPYYGFFNGNFIATHVSYDEEKTVITTGLFTEKSELLVALNQREDSPLQPWPRNDPDARVKRFADVMSRNAFMPKEAIAVDMEETIYFSFSNKYEINIFSSKGKIERKIRTSLPFQPVTKRDQENFLNIWVPKDITTWGTMDEGMKKRIKNLIRFPSNKPALLEIIPMDNGYILILRDGFFGQKALIDIFDSKGRFIIEKELSFPIKNGLVRGDHFYTTYEDENGYQFVKRYGIRFIHNE